MIVFDTSAVLAFLYAEPGHQTVQSLLDKGRISAANWSETLQKIAFHGGDSQRQGSLLMVLGLTVEPLTGVDAERAAQLYPTTREAGLSLGDRCCLALAHRLRAPAVTADRAWADVDAGIELRQIR